MLEAEVTCIVLSAVGDHIGPTGKRWLRDLNQSLSTNEAAGVGRARQSAFRGVDRNRGHGHLPADCDTTADRVVRRVDERQRRFHPAPAGGREDRD